MKNIFVLLSLTITSIPYLNAMDIVGFIKEKSPKAYKLIVAGEYKNNYVGIYEPMEKNSRNSENSDEYNIYKVKIGGLISFNEVEVYSIGKNLQNHLTTVHTSKGNIELTTLDLRDTYKQAFIDDEPITLFKWTK